MYLIKSIHCVPAFLSNLRQLGAYVHRANEDALQVGPCPLHLKPDGYDRVSHRQLALPRRHFIQEVGDVLGRHEVLQLDLVVLQSLDKLLVRAQQGHLGAVVGLILELHSCMGTVNWSYSPDRTRVQTVVTAKCVLPVPVHVELSSDRTFSIPISLTALSTIPLTSSSKQCRFSCSRSARAVPCSHKTTHSSHQLHYIISR